MDGVLAEVVRSGFVEGRHGGSLVALGSSGAVAFSVGDPDAPALPRSSNKPMQAVGLLRAGLDLDGELLALTAASHAGESFHLEGVRKILADAGLDESALRTPASLPLDDGTLLAHQCAGGIADPIFSDCSGKHAAMLAVCVRNGWPVEDYIAPEHPVQQAIRGTVADLAGEPIAWDAVDGCGAPLLGVTLSGLARAFRTIVLAEPGSPERRVADAMRAYPEYVAGTHRFDTLAMQELPGLLTKRGIEGVQAAALPDGSAIAFKIADGSPRAAGPVLARALTRLGVAVPELDVFADLPLYGGTEVVGEIRAGF